MAILRNYKMNLLRFKQKHRTFSTLSRGFFHRLCMPKSIGKRVKIGRNVEMYHNIKLSDHVSIDSNVELRCAKTVSIKIGCNTSISRNTVIFGKVSIGAHTAIAPGCMIIGVNHGFSNVDELICNQPSICEGVVIGDNIWIGANVVVLDGVQIGTGCVIGAGSVVTKSIPPYSIAVGNPCKVIKSRLQD